MDIREYELYNLDKDISQSENIIKESANADFYINLIDKKLDEIKKEGYNWEKLPNANRSKKIKTEWVRY